ncbi:13002_t:CDS:1 [Ambispora gerdemannii]|uniref:13002_t:CDS:1 n=1 Tax=Ambispora gerdemannii TaxID=144530 RepID=A0A9N9FET2_9GLOM|nr:13002_t:CDS:1 [Ambispora gerdemannii]
MGDEPSTHATTTDYTPLKSYEIALLEEVHQKFINGKIACKPTHAIYSEMQALIGSKNRSSKYVYNIAEKCADQSKYWTLLAYFNDEGFGTPKNRHCAFQYYKKAAELGDPIGQEGAGFSKFEAFRDDKEAHDWTLNAAKAGMGLAAYKLYSDYGFGHKAEKNELLSIYWLKRSAEIGHLEARLDLGERYKLGIQVPKDLRKSFYWYKRSLEVNPKKAIILAFCYIRGKGTAVDYHETLKYFRYAKKHGLPVNLKEHVS